MAQAIFKIDSYKIVLGESLESTWTQKIHARGVIGCYSGDGDKFFIYFLTDTSPVPRPEYSPEKKVAAIFLPAHLMPLYTDILRNEKPIFAFLDSENPSQNCLRTSREPVGEEEGR